MLILARRPGETFMVDDDVSVTVISIRGNQIQIGINAPKEVKVHREEIYKKIKREQSLQNQPIDHKAADVAINLSK